MQIIFFYTINRVLLLKVFKYICVEIEIKNFDQFEIYNLKFNPISKRVIIILLYKFI